MTTTLICIVTGQTQANMVPILNEKPTHIVLLTSERMSDSAQALKKLIKELTDTPDEHIHIIAGLPDHNMEAIRTFALESFEQITNSFTTGEITFNATGGNKLMTLAFTEMLQNEKNTRITYLDSYNRVIETLYPQTALTPMQPIMDIKTWLKVQGKTLLSIQSHDEQDDWQSRKSLTKWIGSNLNNHTIGLISVLNGMCQKALEQPQQTFNNSKHIGPDWQAMLSQCHNHQLIEWQQETPTDITFIKQKGIQYLSGGWLEEYTYWIAQEALPQAEVIAGVEFIDDFKRASNIRNEIDVLVKHQNQLLIIECKTGKGLSSETPYKIQANKQQAGGVMSQALLISVQPIKYSPHGEAGIKTNANLKDRVKSFGIHTCEAEEIQHLKTTLQNLF